MLVLLEFYFNYKEAFIGVLQSSPSSGGRCLPFPHFIATPLLPCGKVNKPIEKFSGNDDIGSEPDRPITEAVHAFAHFSYLYSKGFLVFVDLQGMLDKKGIMCLIDPQVHT